MLAACILACGEQVPRISILSVEPDRGPISGGTQVTVFGTNLGDDLSVQIGGQELTGLTVLNSTSVTGTTPAGSTGAQDVVVTSERGSATLPGGFTYLPLPPAVDGITPLVGPMTGGTLVTITGSHFTEVQSVTIGGRSATEVTVLSDTSLTATAPAGMAGDQDVIVINPYGFGALAGGFHYAEYPRQFGTAANDEGAGIALSPDGGVYVVGATQGAFPTYTNQGSDDVAIVKYGANGPERSVQRGSVFADRAEAVAVDLAGTAYTVGYTRGSLNPGWSAGGSDFFVATTRSTGTFWDQTGTNADDRALAVTTIPSSSTLTYVVGQTFGTFPYCTSAGGADLFVYQIANFGQRVTLQYGTAGDDSATGIAHDASTGLLYIVGTTTGAFPGYTNAGGSDVFILKTNGGGTVRWVTQLGTAADDLAEGVGVDPNGDAYLVGTTSGAFPGATSAGSTDLFVAKFGPTGAQQWLRQIGTPEADHAGGIAVDSSGNAYVAGWTRGAFPGFTNAGEDDILLTKLNLNGALQWTQQIGSASFDEGRGVALDGAGTIYVTGWSGGELPGCTTVGLKDMFLLKFNPSGLRL